MHIKGPMQRHNFAVTQFGNPSFVPFPFRVSHGFTDIGSKPSRLLDTILPGLFDNYFVELAALFAAGDPSEEQIDALSRKYQIKYL